MAAFAPRVVFVASFFSLRVLEAVQAALHTMYVALRVVVSGIGGVGHWQHSRQQRSV